MQKKCPNLLPTVDFLFTAIYIRYTTFNQIRHQSITERIQDKYHILAPYKQLVHTLSIKAK